MSERLRFVSRGALSLPPSLKRSAAASLDEPSSDLRFVEADVPFGEGSFEKSWFGEGSFVVTPRATGSPSS